ncbi:MAG: hypothetical protein IPJ65_36415 [Archangiaceae bacterium]|nr:hypothetical protein [Archangiaceae bacterium]
MIALAPLSVGRVVDGFIVRRRDDQLAALRRLGRWVVLLLVALVQGCGSPASPPGDAGADAGASNADGGDPDGGGDGRPDAGQDGGSSPFALGAAGTSPYRDLRREYFARSADGTLHQAFDAANGSSRGVYYGRCAAGCSSPDAWSPVHLFDDNQVGLTSGTVSGFGIDGSGRRHLLFSRLYVTCASGCDHPSGWARLDLASLLTTSADSLVQSLGVKADGTVGIVTRGSPNHPPQYAECRGGCTSLAGWTVRELGFTPLPLNVVVDETGVTHLLLESQDVYGDLHYSYARCPGACTEPGNWQKSQADFLHRTPGENAGFAVTSSGRIFLAFNRGHPVVTSAQGGVIDDLVLASCASNCLLKDNWTSVTLDNDFRHEGLVGGVWLTGDGERLWLGTTTAHEVRLRSCTGDCARVEAWSPPTEADTDDAIAQAMPPDVGSPCPGHSTSAAWAPALPTIAVSSKGLVIAHHPRRVVLCPGDSTVYRPPPIGRLRSTF